MGNAPLILTLKTAFTAIIITFLLGIYAARLVISAPKRVRAVMDGVFTLPLVLPPTVLGFFLLLTFGKNSFIGQLLARFDMRIVFSWSATVIAAVVVAFPLLYRTARGAFEQLDQSIVLAARTLGLSEGKIFWRIILPNSIHGVIAGTILAFARALGEFGATLMIAGNIPGKTQTVSLLIYTAVSGGDMALAMRWVIVISGISLATVVAMNLFLANPHLFRKERKKDEYLCED